MYWSRTGSVVDLLLLGLHCALWAAGGWLLACHAFRLETRERLVTGAGIGLAAYLFAANLLGRVLDPTAAFWAGAVIVLVSGVAAGLRSGRVWVDRRDLDAWPLAAMVGALGLLTTLVGRGLTVFDDPRNVSIISTMAAGDIPPHFFLDSSVLFNYHYGFQILGATWMRIGGLFPWSAYDLSKGLVAGLTIGLIWLVGRRLTRRWEGGLVLAFLAVFSGGARWMLLLLPPSLLAAASRGVELWGSAAASAESLWDGLGAPWIVGGGPPSPIPFAYVSGVFQPFVLAAQIGPPVLSLGFLAVLILTAGRLVGAKGWLVLSAVMAVWALTWEVSYILFAAGLMVVGLAARAWRRGPPSLKQLRWALLATGLSFIPAILQGGSLSEAAKDIVRAILGSGGSGAGGISFRWSPVIISSHLGELSLADPLDLVVALAEMGAGLLAAPLVTWAIHRWVRSGRYVLAAIAAGSIIGFVVPWFVDYRVTRDLSRFHGFALLNWILLAIPLLTLLYRRRPEPGWASGILAWVFLCTFGGVVVMSSLLTALPQAVLTEKVAPLDAQMAVRFWDRLPDGAEILDSVPHRAVLLTGRLTRAANEEYEGLADYYQLLEEPSASRVAQAGFRYVYIDREWWDALPDGVQASYQEDCTTLLGHLTDNAFNGDRWLFDVGGCGGPP